MIFYYNNSTDPYYNLALEEHIFLNMQLNEPLFMLWQNDSSIVIGRNQNALKEINMQFIKEKKIKIVRRNTGGGTVYHDLGNLNYSFIQNCGIGEVIDFSQFAVPIIHALDQLGVNAQCNDRNDLIIDNRKFSGTAQASKNGHMLHHGTLLFNSDLNLLRQVLMVDRDKIDSKGVKSISSHITNISEHLKNPMTIDQFRNCLIESVCGKNDLVALELAELDLRTINALKDEKYDTWEWTYGKAPRYEVRKSRNFNGGCLKVSMKVLAKGIIDYVSIEGEFSGNQNIGRLEEFLKGKIIKESVLLEVLSYIDINDYITGMTAAEFAKIIIY
jgi:lipoate-protein ligase A